MSKCNECGHEKEDRIIEVDAFSAGMLLGILGHKARYVSVTTKGGETFNGFYVIGNDSTVYRIID